MIKVAIADYGKATARATNLIEKANKAYKSYVHMKWHDE